MLTATTSGIVLEVRVIPRAKKTSVSGVRDNALLIRLAAPPVEDAANDALIDFLAAALRVRRQSIRILSGDRSRRKQIAIDRATVDSVRAALLSPRPGAI